MSAVQTVPLGTLFEQDETAWLETMADLVCQQRFAELDCQHLSGYLHDMARRDRREVFSRLVSLMSHLLKWDYQPDQRSASWRGTIRSQRRELLQLLEGRTLSRHAEAVLDDAYSESREQAADETGLAVGTFPIPVPWKLEDILQRPLA